METDGDRLRQSVVDDSLAWCDGRKVWHELADFH